jgi:hypothetical protein
MRRVLGCVWKEGEGEWAERSVGVPITAGVLLYMGGMRRDAFSHCALSFAWLLARS